MSQLRNPCKDSLAEDIKSAFSKMGVKFEEAFPGTEPVSMQIADTLEKPPEPHPGDYAFPCFRLAKVLKKAPPAIATELVTLLNQGRKPGSWFKEAIAVGPFANFLIDKTVLAKVLLPKVCDGTYRGELKADVSRSSVRVMVEYSQPNTHKEFHVGHVRNVALGGALCELFKYAGYQVVAANYIGDEGTHIAKCLWHIQKKGLKAPEEKKGEWLGDMYAEATRTLANASEEDRKLMDQEVSQVLREIESKRGPIYDEWKKTRQWSLDDFNANYAWLGIAFDHFFYESEFTEEGQLLVDEYQKLGFFKEDQGAIGIDLSPYKLGFMIVRKRDGNILYATRDLALARKKFNDFKIDRSIVVVACEQNHHFKQVFKTLELMGFPQAKSCYHLSYGMVVLPEGKMSSRAGNSVTFNTLRTEMLSELHQYLEKYKDEWTPQEIEETAHRLCQGAIKYGMLYCDANREIVFDLKNWLSFEGNTGPYLMYSSTRTQSILRKAEEQGSHESFTHLDLLAEESEHELLRYLFDFNEIALQAAELYKPSLLTNHLFYMCKSFNRFYTDVPVLKASSEELLGARLALISAFSSVLKTGLSLLGIIPPDKM